MSETGPANPEEPASGAGSSAIAADATDGAGATMPAQAARLCARQISQDAATGWLVLIFVVAQAVGTAFVWIWYSGDLPVSTKSYDGTLVALVTLVTNPTLVGLFCVVVRYRGLDVREYLGLTHFTLRNFVVGLVTLVLLAGAFYLLSYFAKLDLVPRFQTDTFTSARRDGWLVPLLLAVVLVGPIGEEITFRGFLYRGWVRPGFVITPIILITLFWSAMHIQYDWFGILQVFLTGLLLGWLRWLSGSTSLTIVLHVLVNLEATIETVVKVGWAAS